MASERASVIIAPAHAGHEFTGRVLLSVPDESDANPQKRGELGVRGLMFSPFGAAGVHFGLEFAEQRSYVRVVDNDYVIHRRQRRDQRRAGPLGQDGPAFAFQFSRLRIGINRHDQQIALGARRAEIANVPGTEQIENSVREHDSLSRATMFLENSVQTTAGENSGARIH
jgi:hypothetical protein